MTKQAELREQLDAAYTVLAIQGSPFESEEDTAKIREEASKTIDRLITTHQKQLLEELLSELPEKYDLEYEKHIDSYQYGCNETIDQVSALIEKKLKEQNQ